MNKDSDEDNVVSFDDFKAKVIEEDARHRLIEEGHPDYEEFSEGEWQPETELSFDIEDLFPALGDILPTLLTEHMSTQNETLKHLDDGSFASTEDEDSVFFQPDEEINPADLDVFEPLLNCLSSLHTEMVSTELSIKADKVWDALSKIDKEISALSILCTKWRNK